MNDFHEPHRLSHQSAIPLYYQLKEVLRNQIRKKEYKDRDMLPSEHELVEMYGVSRQVARRALAELANEGLIVSRKGVGSFVNKRRFTKQLSILGSFTRSLEVVSENSYTKVLRKEEIFLDQPITESLGLSRGSKGILVQRVGFIEDEPIAEMKAHFPLEVGEFFLEEDLGGKSLYQLLNQHHQINPHYAEWILRVTPADSEQASLLDIKEGFSLISNYSTTFTQDNTPFEYSILSYRSDRIEFAITGFKRENADGKSILIDM